MGKRLYRPKMTQKTEPLGAIDRIEIAGIVIAAIALASWTGVSAYNTLTTEQVRIYSEYTEGFVEISDQTESEELVAYKELVGS